MKRTRSSALTQPAPTLETGQIVRMPCGSKARRPPQPSQRFSHIRARARIRVCESIQYSPPILLKTSGRLGTLGIALHGNALEIPNVLRKVGDGRVDLPPGYAPHYRCVSVGGNVGACPMGGESVSRESRVKRPKQLPPFKDTVAGPSPPPSTAGSQTRDFPLVTGVSKGGCGGGDSAPCPPVRTASAPQTNSPHSKISPTLLARAPRHFRHARAGVRSEIFAQGFAS